MSKLKRFIDETPFSLSGKDKEKAIKIINESLSSLLVLRDLIKTDKVVVSNIDTHLSLNESFHAELSKILGYDSILAKEYEERHLEIRKKNEEIRQLKEQRGKEVTPEAITGALRLYEDIFRAWYENEGFEYGSISSKSDYGMTVELTSNMNFTEDTSPERNPIYQTIWSDDISTESKIKNGWDIYESQFHAELLDTDNNKKRIKELLLKNFPKVSIHSFCGRRNDYGSFSLRVEFYISYSDLDNYYKSLF